MKGNRRLNEKFLFFFLSNVDICKEVGIGERCNKKTLEEVNCKTLEIHTKMEFQNEFGNKFDLK